MAKGTAFAVKAQPPILPSGSIDKLKAHLRELRTVPDTMRVRSRQKGVGKKVSSPASLLRGQWLIANRRMRELEAKVQSYERIFGKLQDSTGSYAKQTNQDLLAGVIPPIPSNGSLARAQADDTLKGLDVIMRTPEGAESDTDDDDGNEIYYSGDEGSDGSFETLSEDINTLSINNPNGFMGRGSEVSWLKLLRHELNIDDKTENEQLRARRHARGDTAGLDGPNTDMVGLSLPRIGLPCSPADALTSYYRGDLSPRRY
jgi:hypothetical protein